MASPLKSLIIFILTPIISTHVTTTTHVEFSEQSHIKLPTNQPHHIAEKQTHLYFFYHDILEGKNPTVVQIIQTPSTSSGTTFMMDNLLTEESKLTSKPVGIAQGLFGLASLQDRGMVMLINFTFTEGEYAGSTLNMLGRNSFMDTVRDMLIVSGTGVFRFAKGNSIAKSI